jgi:predicted phosphoadenosine phosphosulfate sulfurtransferase
MRGRIRKYVSDWEARGYPNGIPDEAPFVLERLNKVGSYRLICLAILKNDTNLLTLGYSRPECLIYRALKREELMERGLIPYDQLNQADLF